MYILQEYFFKGYSEQFLYFLYISSIICAIFVIISKNPVISVLFLIGLFLSVSAYLIIIGINFIGLSYLLVYVGAVSILFIFILMLINVRISELTTDTNNSIPLALIICVLFIYPIYDTIPSYELFTNLTINKYDNSNLILFATSTAWDSSLIESYDIVNIGGLIYTNYYIWLIISSLILLLGMVGTICLVIN